MTKVLRLVDFRRSAQVVHFSRTEINQLLSLYSRQVTKGLWRDYAIDHDDTVARFHVFRHAGEKPLFTVVKRRDAGASAAAQTFSLYAGTHRMRQGEGLLDLLEALEHRMKLVRS
ncbi:hypothetical protein CKO38_14330 [Rhodospirillum rubrum]|uniref:DUF2794 domain-containing protein n=1 Tax=Rhodospirillum rubrum TaxID=1085 RepID=UPI001904FACD|nr:DUF2794 domain-containing protein [Rhodospirillum rubrum]MBK1665700.1 hypothetical protein [Rhodospirillum rubrum]MBK1677824.1 hypothetical protein [Rhodospirillum rubrum]